MSDVFTNPSWNAIEFLAWKNHDILQKTMVITLICTILFFCISKNDQRRTPFRYISSRLVIRLSYQNGTRGGELIQHFNPLRNHLWFCQPHYTCTRHPLHVAMQDRQIFHCGVVLHFVLMCNLCHFSESLQEICRLSHHIGIIFTHDLFIYILVGLCLFLLCHYDIAIG